MQIKDNNNIVQINSCGCCAKTLKPDWEFCPYCRTKISYTNCIYCGKGVKDTWNFCPYCKNEIKSELAGKQKADKCNEWLRNILKK